MINHILDIIIFDNGYTVGFEQDSNPGDYASQVRNMGHNIIGMDHVSPCGPDHVIAGPGLHRKIRLWLESRSVRRDAGNISSRFYPKDVNPFFFIVFEQVTVIARQFYH